MNIAGKYTFNATRDEVWAALNDPEVLARSIPGCQKLEQVGENEFESTLKIGLQAVKGVYQGRVRLEDIQPPHHYNIVVDGKGSNGFLRGEGGIELEDLGDTTGLIYKGEAQVGGPIASVGQRLLDGASKSLISQSLKALAAQIEARKAGTPGNGQQAGESVPAGESQATGDAAEPAASQGAPQQSQPASEPVTPSREAPASDATTSPQPEFFSPPASSATPQPSFERRSIVVPDHEQLSEGAVAVGMVTDFLKETPWLPWVVVAFLVGYLFGKRQ